ncbi:uncharacterized protein SCHCODRAFT_01273846 [Schizophyllum commune H4-8]|uniref:uncharacterized protein n=1 Tax=Schizophyllum commune (strain H4-8 / FGSC 9210) TaxID=578458 RepID=UPI0021606231|nr:uncharacterized protein SCHCODRAFT_01273846 [Schizophyllum commune H4-8]KAI5899427.1 hypothetical protein SCHCODRAFT_01273846 [Schizophyllum commune H4-8]
MTSRLARTAGYLYGAACKVFPRKATVSAVLLTSCVDWGPVRILWSDTRILLSLRDIVCRPSTLASGDVWAAKWDAACYSSTM